MRGESDFLLLLRVLSRHRIDFIVIGGVSGVLHGAPIATFDLDIIHSRSPDNLQRLENALLTLRAYYREHAERRPVPEIHHLAGAGHHLLMTDAGPLDVLGEVSDGKTYEDLLGDTVELEVDEGLRVRVLSLSCLIRLKEMMGGEKDLATLPILRRTLEEQRGRDTTQ